MTWKRFFQALALSLAVGAGVWLCLALLSIVMTAKALRGLGA